METRGSGNALVSVGYCHFSCSDLLFRLACPWVPRWLLGPSPFLIQQNWWLDLCLSGHGLIVCCDLSSILNKWPFRQTSKKVSQKLKNRINAHRSIWTVACFFIVLSFFPLSYFFSLFSLPFFSHSPTFSTYFCFKIYSIMYLIHL